MKLKLFACCLLLAGTASASEKGVYVGGKFGVQSLTSEMTTSDLTLNSLGSEGSQFGLFSGYSAPIFGRHFWGLEAEYISHSVSAEIKGSNQNIELNLEKEYGLSVLFGKLYSNHVNIYGRLGAGQAFFDGKGLDNTGSDDVLAVHAGFGVELKGKFPSMVNLRAEYRYTKYSEVNFSQEPTVVKNSPRSHSFSMGLVYRY